MMSIVDIEKITTVLTAMMHYERTLADFYNQCAVIWPEDQAFWQSLASAEVGHAENIQKMREVITNKQEKFEAGRPFNLIALNTALAGLKDTIGRLAAGKFSHQQMLVVARDIENSLLESNYAEIVKTGDLEYRTLMKSILSQTHEHRKIIQEKIGNVKIKV